ncbi:MAG: hypothetical protein AABY13_01280, partial [Nanoarchaeota archaeon]
MRPSLIIPVLLCCLLATTALAHEGEAEETPLEDSLREASLIAIAITATVMAALTYAAVCCTTRVWKKRVFLAMVMPVVAVTALLVVSTAYINAVSETGGPVHWHADFEIYKCGVPVDLVAPTGFVNKVGVSTLHEHGDARMHVEGVVMARSDVDLHAFFEAVGGTLTHGRLVVPTDHGTVEASDGELCGSSAAAVQVFLMTVQEGVIAQRKLALYDRHIIAPESNVPPGDCIIIEFDAEKPRTEHVCES